MFALFDEHVLRSLVEDPARGLHQVGVLGELACFAVVERDQVDVPEEFNELGATRFDPEVHGVAGDEARFLHLLEHLELQAGIDVGEKDERRFAELVGNIGPKIREHAEMRLERFGGVEIVAIASTPAEAGATDFLETRQIHAALDERLQQVEGVVVTDHAHQLHRREVRRRRREIGARSAEHIIGLTERRLDGIERDGPDDEHLIGGTGETAHMRSGADSPRMRNPAAMPSCVARASTRRARVMASGSPRT